MWLIIMEGETKLDKLTESFVKDKISEHLLESNMACNTQKGIYCVLNQILKYASAQYSIILPSII